ncbi:uncharacterized protein LOC143620178 [Bidens hawaiensis]|uniref:uncharacterized protein LOC143620178 n=1 Tax=Bidens hawaiensis TaxID=980011 RepID=UPI00404A7D54
MGFDERRIHLEKKHGRKISWMDMFFDTNLTNECKTRLWAGELDINEWERFEFCSEQSKETYAEYMRSMIELYGSDLTQHPTGDPDVWAKVQALGGSRSWIFEIGSLDPHVVVIETPARACESGPYFDARRSQKEVQKIRAQLEIERKGKRRLGTKSERNGK